MAKTKSKYTVIMMLPDFIASNYGQESYLAHVEASSPDLAVKAAEQVAIKAFDNYSTVAAEWFALCCFAGHLEDVNPN